jgi:AbrB family looped-hinge helix DNA binding protein
MSIIRVKPKGQVTLPVAIREELGLKEGDFVEVKSERGTVILKPKKVVNPDDVLTSEEARIVRRGLAQMKRGDHIALEQIERDLERTPRKRRRKATPKSNSENFPLTVKRGC